MSPSVCGLVVLSRCIFMIRQPIICVMGHVDHGKTTLLDKIRNSAITAKEAGGITQHIGASEVPLDTIRRICGGIQFGTSDIKIPGLLFIDTPGHEAFTNLRRRGDSVADLAILVVDIMQGFQPQTVEAIDILKEYKTPFIIAANKIDLITGWRNTGSKSFAEAIKQQQTSVAAALESKIFELIGRVSEYGFSSDIYNKVTNFQKELAIVPLSAKTGEGIAELLMLAVGLSQKFLEIKLNIEIDGPAKGSIIEKKEIKGLGTTIDVILYDGTLSVNDVVAFANLDGTVSTTKVKALLKPKPLHELVESTSKFYNIDHASAAAGIKISAIGLEDSMPGSPIVSTSVPDYESEIKSELSDIFKTEQNGIVLKADSIGTIEALSKLLSSAKVPISKKGIGNVTKRDVIDTFSMNAVDPAYAAILAFNVQIDEDAAAALSMSGIKVISSNIIYKLVEDYMQYADSIRKNKISEIEKRIVLPAQIEIMPNSCFRVSHPAIFGVSVLAGAIKPGTPMINEEGVFVGRIKGIQNEGTPLEKARKGDMVAISMDEPFFGRQVKEGQTLFSKVTETDAKLLKGEFSSLLNGEEAELLDKILQISRR